MKNQAKLCVCVLLRPSAGEKNFVLVNVCLHFRTKRQRADGSHYC